METDMRRFTNSIIFGILFLVISAAAEASRPVHHYARELFDPAITFSSGQRQLLARMDSVYLRGLVVKDLFPAEVISEICARLAAQGISDVVITTESVLDPFDGFVNFKGRHYFFDGVLANLSRFTVRDSCAGRITFMEHDCSLANALYGLSRITEGQVRYELRGSAVIAIIHHSKPWNDGPPNYRPFRCHEIIPIADAPEETPSEYGHFPFVHKYW